MRESPRRPLILKRRKLPFQRNDGQPDRDTKIGPQAEAGPASTFPDGIRIMDHPTMPDTQVVVIPKTADLQSVISALTTKGKKEGPQGPNKFILLSGSDIPDQGANAVGCEFGPTSLESSLNATAGPEGCVTTDFMKDFKPLINSKYRPLNRMKTIVKKEVDGSMLDDSLTNIQWLGKMDSSDADPKPQLTDSYKENLGDCSQKPRHAEKEVGTSKDQHSKRPPYSYMAMIQFAINSKADQRMTLKEIYNWIAENFPYFRNVAKPGWKNSIRHNLSLHDMFVRESTADNKVSYWTIRPDANRCLTLDQVYKPLVDPAAPHFPQTLQQQKRVVSEPKKLTPAGSTERKMKRLLPRTDSYLVPIQLPLAPSLLVPTQAPMPLSSLQQMSAPRSSNGGKRVCIAPKIEKKDPNSDATRATASVKLKKEPESVPNSYEPPGAPLICKKDKLTSSSRRKQRLVMPASEEPVLLFADSTFFDSGVASDISTFQDTREVEPELKPQLDSPGRSCAFKTPIKSNQPASSTPSKPPATLEPWRVTPLGKGSNTFLDFSPIRTPNGPLHTPKRHKQSNLSFSSTPFKELPLFSSPHELLNIARPSPLRAQPSCSRELQVSSSPGLNRSLTEGLVLDTMNDSLSKILVDISFSGLEDNDLSVANLSWSQLIPELK